MKRENGIYLLAFLCGVVAANVLGDSILADSSLNRYSLAAMSFHGIVYEEYFFDVLFLRFRTAVGLWVCTKVISKKSVFLGFALVMCGMLGGITAMAILANGLWGILFCLCALLPHSICYGMAYSLWGNARIVYSGEGKKVQNYIVAILIVMLIGIGCILETYVSPVFIKNLIKY